MSATPDRDRIFAIQRARKGLGYNVDRDQYVAELFPYDTDAGGAEMASHMYSCGLNGLAYLRLFLMHTLLNVPYASRIGKAPDDVEEIAKDYGVLLGEVLPTKGDIVRVGDFNPVYGGPVHVIVVVDYDPTTGVFTTSEGGQPLQGAMGILEKQVIAVLDAQGNIRLVDAAKSYLASGQPNGRRIKHTMRFSSLLPKH